MGSVVLIMFSSDGVKEFMLHGIFNSDSLVRVEGQQFIEQIVQDIIISLSV